MKRLTMALVFGLMLAMIPVSVSADVHPMVGSWESIDGSQFRLQVGGGGTFHLQKQSGANVGCPFFTIVGEGSFNVESDVLTLDADAISYCFLRGKGGRTVSALFPNQTLTLSSDGNTISYLDLTLYRTGSAANILP
jgi:hypothetical protein